jgi:AraC-like DNA-binding protein
MAATQAQLSARHLQRVFEHELGTAPKTFARILRFRRAIQAMRYGATISAAAHTAGYSDQAHFSRDCQVQSLMTPTALHSHVAIVQDSVSGDLIS